MLKRHKRKRRKKRVREPLTDELLQELLDSPTIEQFDVAHELSSRSISEYLQSMLDAHNLKRIDVIHAANLNETFGYQIFTGARQASRDKLLQIAFAMGLTLQETGRLLQAGGANGLYCKNRRDAIILFCLNRNASLAEVNEELYRFGEQTIC